MCVCWRGEGGTDSYLVNPKMRMFLAVFVVDGDGHLFWDCPFSLFVRIRHHPEFLPS